MNLYDIKYVCYKDGNIFIAKIDKDALNKHLLVFVAGETEGPFGTNKCVVQFQDTNNAFALPRLRDFRKLEVGKYYHIQLKSIRENKFFFEIHELNEEQYQKSLAIISHKNILGGCEIYANESGI